MKRAYKNEHDAKCSVVDLLVTLRYGHSVHIFIMNYYNIVGTPFIITEATSFITRGDTKM